MGWAAITAATGDSAPAGGWSSGMHPPFLFCLAKRETGRARSKEKNAWRTPVRWPSVRTGVGVSVRAPILPALRARLGFLRFLGLPSRGGWCSFVGVVVALPLLLFSLPLVWRATGAGAAGGCGHPPLRRSGARPIRRGRPVCRPLQERQPQRRGRCPHPPESINPYDHPGSA